MGDYQCLQVWKYNLQSIIYLDLPQLIAQAAEVKENHTIVNSYRVGNSVHLIIGEWFLR